MPKPRFSPETAPPNSILCASGHRSARVGGYTPEARAKLQQFAEQQLMLLRPKQVISGMAIGWDTAVAQAAVYLGIPFIAAIPFPAQPSRWSPADIKTWIWLKEQAIHVHYSAKSYTPDAFQLRNIWTVDNSHLVLALHDGEPGGTANCLRYAKSVNREILNTWAEWRAFQPCQ